MLLDIVYKVSAIYEEIDRKALGVKLATGLRCPNGCGICCESSGIEATVLEVLPLALELCLKQRAEAVHQAIRQKEKGKNLVCLFYRSGQTEQDRQRGGACDVYPFRPLICRLFGYSARRSRRGFLEFCPCREMKRFDPEGVAAAQEKAAEGMPVAVYQDFFMRVATLAPSLGFNRMPINQAIRQALEYLYWKTPAPSKRRQAA